MKILLLAGLGLLLSACASVTPVSELRGDVNGVTFVQLGSEPLSYSFGVVDTSSFWAAYGDGVSSQLGGGALWTGLAADGRNKGMEKMPENARILRELYGNHSLVPDIREDVLPQLAGLWSVDYRPGDLQIREKGEVEFDQEGNLVGFDGASDLVLMYSVGNITLTERFSMGGALASGLTMGTNTKSVTTTAAVRLQAYKRDPATGRHANIWTMGCGANYTQMKTAYPFPEVVKSEEKVAELLDETARISIDGCNKTIARFSQQASK